MEQTIILVLSLASLGGGLALHHLVKVLGGYTAEKGKNLAQKEDIAALTRIVEDIKQQNAVLLEDYKVKNQLRLAAIERRLQAHQEAYALWRRLVGNAYGDPVKRGQLVMEAQTWWENNCLYLGPDARASFFQCLFAVNSHHGMVQNRTDAVTIRENWSLVKEAGEVLVRAAALPGFTIEERKDVDQLLSPPG